MCLTLGTALAVGGGLGALGGAVKGAKGTPDEKQISDTSNTSATSSSQQTTFNPATEQEKALQQGSMAAYQQQQQIQDQLLARVGQLDPYQQQAQAAAMGVLSGQAMGTTPQEQAQIMAVRQAQIDYGSADVNRLLDQRLQQAVSNAANQGLRGQAMGSLQGDVLRAGAEQMGNITRQANLTAAQQAMQLPYQRIAAQQPFISQGMTLADQLRQNMFINQQALQSPYMLDMLNKERMAGGRTSQSGTSRGTNSGVTTVPGQAGSFGGALMGGLGGAISGGTSGMNLYGGYQNAQLTNSLLGRLNAEGTGTAIQSQVNALPQASDLRGSIGGQFAAPQYSLGMRGF